MCKILSIINKFIFGNDTCELKINDKVNMNTGTFIVKDIITTFSFGNVLLVTNNENNKDYVIKEYIIKECINNNIKNELEAFQHFKKQKNKLGYANIMHVIDLKYHNKNILMLMEYAQQGDLLDCMNNKQIIEENIKEYFRDIVKGLYLIHNCGFCNRDISLENCLLFDNNEVKLADFDFSVPNATFDASIAKDYIGKDAYVSPEISNKQLYDGKASDIWSLGCLFFVLKVKAYIFTRSIKSDKYFEYYCTYGLEKLLKYRGHDKFFNENEYDLLKNLLELNPEKRLTIKQVLDHAYFK